MKLLITGGAGFIGSALIRWLLSPEGEPDRQALGLESVINLDALTYAGNLANLTEVEGHPAYRFIHGDIADAARVNAIFSEEKITSVIHLAAESHVDRSIDDPRLFLRTNIEGTFQILEAARRHWTGPDHRFIQVSTDEVFGALEPAEAPFCESTRYAPNSPYAASKAAGDHLARAYFRTYGVPVMVTNSSNNYGRGQFPEKLIPLIVLNALEEKPLPIYGDGGQVRDWIFVEDHVRGLLAALGRGKAGQTYLFGGGAEITNLELVHHICAWLDDKQPRRSGRYADLITHVTDRPGHDRRYAVDSVRAREELGWAPRETLASGVARTLDWYLANRPWCDAVTRERYGRERLGLG